MAAPTNLSTRKGEKMAALDALGFLVVLGFLVILGILGCLVILGVSSTPRVSNLAVLNLLTKRKRAG